MLQSSAQFEFVEVACHNNEAYQSLQAIQIAARVRSGNLDHFMR